MLRPYVLLLAIAATLLPVPVLANTSAGTPVFFRDPFVKSRITDLSLTR